jgi:hypothetical protein
MQRWFAALLCLLMVAGSASASEATAEVYAVSPWDGRALLVTADGRQLTDSDSYSSLYGVSDADCPPERRLFAGSGVFVGAPPVGDVAPSALVDARGNRLTDFLYDGFSHMHDAGVVLFYQDNAVGVMDERGNVILGAEYGGIVPDGAGGFLATGVESFSYDPDGYAFMARLLHIAADGTRTDTGIDTVPYLYGQLSDGLLPVSASVGEIWLTGYVNARGDMAIAPIYDGADPFWGGYAVARTEDGLSGIIDTSGNWVVEPMYLSISDTQTGARSIVATRVDNTVDIIDRAAFEVVASRAFPGEAYAYGYEMNAGVILVGSGSGDVYGYGMDGAPLFSLPADAGASVNGSVYDADGAPDRMILTAGDWPEQRAYIVDMALDRVAGPYQELSAAWWKGGEGRYYTARFDLVPYGDGGEQYNVIDYDSYRYGLVDRDGNEILPTVYRQLWHLGDGRYWAKYVDTSGIIDEDGTWHYQMSDYEELMD